MVDTDGHGSSGNGSSSMGNHDSNSVKVNSVFGYGSAAAAGGGTAGASVLRLNVAGSAAEELAGLAMGSPRGLPKYSGVGKGMLNPVLLDMGTMSKR
jgi:hypothetical protein